ncbi:MAG: type III pantothenate kinase [Bacillota bacterium]
MLLAIDVGNTNIVLGVFKGQDLDRVLRVATRSLRTVSEYGMLFRELIPDWQQVKGVSISSVVPPINPTLFEVSRRYFRLEPFTVHCGADLGIELKVDEPRQIGTDRIVNAAAAYHLYGGPVIILDLGTATTCCAVSAAGEFLGGVILPGIGISMEALFKSTAKLPRVELARPSRTIGSNTVASMQSGIYYGYVGMVDGLVERFRREMGGDALVVATGGFSTVLAQDSAYIREINPHLTLQGLRILYLRNRPDNSLS